MKFVHRLVGLFLFVGMLGAATLLLQEPGVVRWLVWRVTSDAILLYSAGGGLMCLAFLFAFSGAPPRKRETFLSFNAPDGGVVSISTQAVCDYLSQLDAEFPSVVRMRPRVVTNRHSVDVICEVRVKADAQVHDVCHVLQKRVRERLTDGLGISEVRRIEVSVREIVTERRAP